jgi:alkylated DNA repair dioxygenase AlkB
MRGAQLSLGGSGEPSLPPDLARLRRIDLGASSWLDHASELVAGHASLFERLERTIAWKQERRVMYERELDVPRLYAQLPVGPALDPLLGELARALASRYQARFEQVGVALYRDGRDSVAWHRDHMPRDRPTLVAILSLGAPRRFALRPFGGGPARSFRLGAGDLLVMGGYCQAHWEHCVPKRSHAEPRMSCVFRYVYER